MNASTNSSYLKTATKLLDLFPPIAPHDQGFLQVDEIHSLYWEDCGNPGGVPVVLLHGGPGAGAGPTHRRFFDPNFYRIIIFDQRGAGRSKPLGCTENNTTEHLIEDIEKLRVHLQVDRWHLFGGSWGSTLALAYAAQNPERCISLILRGIFLCEQPEIDWFLTGMRNIFPEAWEQFAALLDENERDDILKAYYKRLTCGDNEQEIEAGVRWMLYENACSSLYANYETITTDEQKAAALALARLEAHYFLHEVRGPKNSLMHALPVLRKIPATIVQGRYDVICPIKTAHRLHKEWPEANYNVVPDAGHSAMDPPLRSRLIQATEDAKTMTA